MLGITSPRSQILRHTDRDHVPDSESGSDFLEKPSTVDPDTDRLITEEANGGVSDSALEWILEDTTFRQWRDDGGARLLLVQDDTGRGHTSLVLKISLSRAYWASIMCGHIAGVSTQVHNSYGG
jgi:hypothetical protein